MTGTPRRRLALAVLVSAFACCAGPIAALAAVIHVAADAPDGGDGTAARPFRDVNAGIAVAAAGDTVLVRPGTYPGVVRFDRPGKPDAPITVRATLPGAVVVDGADTPADTDLVQIAGDHTVFEGFVVANATRSGISVWGAKNVVVRNNVVTGSRRAGIWTGHSEPGRSAGVVIEGNTVFDNCLENRERNWSSGWPRAIAADLTRDVLIRGNLVHENFGEGIGVLSTEGARIVGNVVFDNFSVNIYLDNAPGTRVADNTVFTTGSAAYLRDGRSAYGVVIANEFTEHARPSAGIAVVNNTLIGVGDVFYSHYEAGGGLTDSIISPNRVVDR